VWLVLAAAAPLPNGALAAPAFEDTIAQRTWPCTICHGKEGRAATDGYYPRIAGKPEATFSTSCATSATAAGITA